MRYVIHGLFFFMIGCNSSDRKGAEDFKRVTSDDDSIKNMYVVYISSSDTGRVMIKSYWDNGALQATSFFYMGRKEGEWFRYFDNGSVSFKGRFTDDKKEGKHLTYKMDGSILSSEEYKNGDSVGVWLQSSDY